MVMGSSERGIGKSYQNTDRITEKKQKVNPRRAGDRVLHLKSSINRITKTMKITFYGATHGVTGSCHLVETSFGKVLFDCGMFQGSDFNEGKNSDDFPFVPSEIRAVFVSHAHLDHTGRIPKLIREGFTGHIYMTKASKELSQIVWDDALEIMEYNNKKFQSPILFSKSDIVNASLQCKGVDYKEEIELGDVRVVFYDAGHIFGSAFIELRDGGKSLVFSGDLGNNNAPIIRDTATLPATDVLLCESTYGDRNHESLQKRDETLLRLLQEGVVRGGTIMIPAFSLERTQELLYRLHDMSEHKKTLPQVPIFLDSPMAIEAIKVYNRYQEYYDQAAEKENKMGDDFLNFPELKLTYTREESKMINSVPGAKIIIAGAGMMNGGRILHHALRYLSDPNSTLLIVGYQAMGTLGRRLYEGAEEVEIFGEKIPVRCTIKALGAFSAHADQEKLIKWIGTGHGLPQKVYFIHGEAHSATAIAHKVRDLYDIKTFVPEAGDQVEI